jgi:hypothetical protein
MSEKKKTAVIVAKGIGIGLLSVLVLGGIGTSIYMNVSLGSRMDEQYAKVSQFIDDEREKEAEELEQTSDYQEDGYQVMGEYEIRSTTQISDAYLAGDPSGLGAEDQETYELASDVLDEIIKDGMSDYEKELAIYDWMVDNIGQGSSHTIALPGQNAQSYTPHDVLQNHNAVCVGYATTFRLLANMVGLEVHIVHNEYHSWDMVKLDDGEWYQLDIYSDVGAIKYRNFNMTDEIAKTSHDWDGSTLPEAKGTKYSYAVQNAKSLSDLFQVPAEIKKAVEESHSGSLYYKFPGTLSEADFSLADQMLSLTQQALYMLPTAVTATDLSGSWLPDGEDGYILAIYYNDYTYTSSGMEDAVPEQVTEMTNKVNEVFDTEVPDPNETYSYTDTYTDIGADGSADAYAEEVVGGADGPTTTVKAEEPW